MSGLSGAEIDLIVKAVGQASQINLPGLYTALKSKSTEAKVKGILVTVEEVAEIVGLFFPVAAVIANDIKAATLILTLLEALQKLPTDHSHDGHVMWGGMDMTEAKGILN